MQLSTSLSFKPADLIFDIGAHTGNKADKMLKMGAHVVCIEPQPKLIQQLHRKFRSNLNVSIVGKALADKPGKLKMSICNESPTISTFSEEWKHGRFSEYNWDTEAEIETTTLDQIIREYGIPQYCKIDVEGFELQVLKGLSVPIPLISFEFTIEFLDNGKRCVDYLARLGFKEFNYMLGENENFEIPAWVGTDMLFDSIKKIDDLLLWGDIYARYPANTDTHNAFTVKEKSKGNVFY